MQNDYFVCCCTALLYSVVGRLKSIPQNVIAGSYSGVLCFAVSRFRRQDLPLVEASMQNSVKSLLPASKRKAQCSKSEGRRREVTPLSRLNVATQ